MARELHGHAYGSGPDEDSIGARKRFHARLVIVGLALGLPSWFVLWTQNWYINPLLFALLWTGATLVMYGLGAGYPGVRRHLGLAALSVPVWWWFELVNTRVTNWQYEGSGRYSEFEYTLFASIAFATVIPALDASWHLFGARFERPKRGVAPARSAVPLLAAGGACHLLVVAIPSIFFPLVWVGPFLIFAGVAGWVSGRTLTGQARWRWSTALRVAGGGLVCGFLWELWNFWATPKWHYEVPHVDFFRVFEMPLLGYGGYVPFAWSIYLLVGLVSVFGGRWIFRRREDAETESA